MQKTRKLVSLLCVMVMVFGLIVPAGAVENNTDTLLSSSAMTELVFEYMNGRKNVLAGGSTSELADIAVCGIVADEVSHRTILVKENISITNMSWNIIDVDVNDAMASIVLEETLAYTCSEHMSSASSEHTITVMFDGNGDAKIVSDRYAESMSGFESCSYISPSELENFEESSPYALSTNCITDFTNIAKSQVGYLEKASNSCLDSFTENPGSGNYTKYGAWYGWNGVAWCAIFVSWCANQAGIPTTVIPKYASCTTGMDTFEDWSRFHASPAYGGSYTPKIGDLFFTGPSADESHHTGIVVSVSSSTITVVDGNWGDKVSKHTYSLTDSSLLGYASPNYCDCSGHDWVNMKYYWKCSVCGTTATSIPDIS